ncbi:Hypothetical predicted protein [Cloeon dipterum]|uniref:Uncharacterized protein n=1 Tax=Cloeon dipterum TaxID=197152 RepID=A0A8S1CI26_9INSE|nr:Hypothetical predicted protein [Cloeon dipterum]
MELFQLKKHVPLNGSKRPVCNRQRYNATKVTCIAKEGGSLLTCSPSLVIAFSRSSANRVLGVKFNNVQRLREGVATSG